MAFIPVIPEDDAEGALADAYEAVRKKRGTVANLWQAQASRPDALRAHLDLYTALMHEDGALDRRERELLGLVTSTLNRNAYGQSHHADAFSRYVKQPGLVPLVAADPAKADLPPRERALADYATRLTKDPHTVTEKHTEELRAAGLTDDEIAEATMIVSYVNFANRLASGLGVTHEDVSGDYEY